MKTVIFNRKKCLLSHFLIMFKDFYLVIACTSAYLSVSNCAHKQENLEAQMLRGSSYPSTLYKFICFMEFLIYLYILKAMLC